MTERAIDIFDRPLKTCSDCEHWSVYYRTAPHGYIQSVCQVEADNRDHQIRRASDYCSKFTKRV
jgi:hypothetical protein